MSKPTAAQKIAKKPTDKERFQKQIDSLTAERIVSHLWELQVRVQTLTELSVMLFALISKQSKQDVESIVANSWERYEWLHMEELQSNWFKTVEAQLKASRDKKSTGKKSPVK